MTEFDRLAHLAWLNNDRSAQQLAACAETHLQDELAAAVAPLQEELDNTRAELDQLQQASGVAEIIKAERAKAAQEVRSMALEIELILRQLAEALQADGCKTKPARQQLGSFMCRVLAPMLAAARGQEGFSQARIALQSRVLPN